MLIFTLMYIRGLDVFQAIRHEVIMLSSHFHETVLLNYTGTLSF